MNMGPMDTPTTRGEFEYRFHLLSHTIQEDKFHVNQGISLQGLHNVRHLPNGRIDFLSVNESARLMANMMCHFQNDELFKQSRDSPEDLDAHDKSL